MEPMITCFLTKHIQVDIILTMKISGFLLLDTVSLFQFVKLVERLLSKAGLLCNTRFIDDNHVLNGLE